MESDNNQLVQPSKKSSLISIGQHSKHDDNIYDTTIKDLSIINYQNYQNESKCSRYFFIKF